MQQHIIRRTEKIKALKEMLKSKQNIYLSSFNYTGKTILISQLIKSLPGKVVHWNASAGGWANFVKKQQETPECTLIIDSLDQITDIETADALSSMLARLPAGQSAVLAGREPMPSFLRNLCACGVVIRLEPDFILFSEEEINQLLLDYGISLSHESIALIQQTYLGWPIVIHSLAQLMLKNPSAPLTSFYDRIRLDLDSVFIQDMILPLPEQERTLLYNLSPFTRFSGDLARMLCGRTDAPEMILRIASKCYFIRAHGEDEYVFFPEAQKALFRVMKNLYDQEYINGQYHRAALFYELNNQMALALRYFITLNDTAKIKELLIRATYLRLGSNDLTELRDAYAHLSEETILSAPELIRGKSMLESYLGKPTDSERWYHELEKFLQIVPVKDSRRQTALDAISYLDIALPHRGSKDILKMFVSFAHMKSLLESKTWRAGFSAAGNSVSLVNGGKDFSRWVSHRKLLYAWARVPVETTLGSNGNGVGELAFAESEYESNLTGDFSSAMEHACRGLAQVTDDTEMEMVAIGIQSRILTAQANLEDALSLIRHMEESLPADTQLRMRQNLTVHRLELQLNSGKTDEALDWLKTDAPDETGAFFILDRYRYLLKLRLYILCGAWKKISFLAARLRQYFEGYDRPYMRIKLHLLQAIANRRSESGSWREEMDAALALAKRYRLVQVIAQEGMAIVDMLNEMNLPDDPWHQGVLNLTRSQAVHYPTYMNQIAEKPVFTEREYQVYSLMIAGYKNAKIASILNITERTVKYYTGEIYRKLGVKTRSEAISRAAELGDI